MKKVGRLVAALWIFFVVALPSFAADSTQTLIIDVRTEAEWNGGHLEGALWIPHERIGERIEEVTKDRSRRIYLYCRSGRRSGIAKQSLQKLRYRDVVDLGSIEDAARILKRRIVK